MRAKAVEEELQLLRGVLQLLTSDINLYESTEFNDFVSSLCNSELPSHLSEHQHVLGMLHYKAKNLHNKKNINKSWRIWEDLYPRQIKCLKIDHKDTRETLVGMSQTAIDLDSDEQKKCLNLWKTKIDAKDVNLEDVVSDLSKVKYLKLHETVYDHLALTLEESDPLMMQAALGKALCLWYDVRDDEAWKIYLRVCVLCGETREIRPNVDRRRDFLEPSGIGDIINGLRKEIKGKYKRKGRYANIYSNRYYIYSIVCLLISLLIYFITYLLL